ncbi:hypothetical protein ACIGT4_05080 [Streptomyces sioyaensis]
MPIQVARRALDPAVTANQPALRSGAAFGTTLITVATVIGALASVAALLR